MTGREKLALKAVLYCAASNEKMRCGNGMYFNMQTKEKIEFDEAICIVKGMLDAAPAANGWISVEDRLPEEIFDKYGEMNLYLVCVEGTEKPFRAFFDGKNWGDGISEADVKYWMPLPEPPEEVQR